VNANQFWQRASDIYTLHHTKFKHALLTDEELRNTVADFLLDMDLLKDGWYNPPENESKK
jgi:hypothetical protein